MRKTIIPFVLLLIIGAIINIGVAWACALWVTQEVWDEDVPVAVPDSWPAYLQELDWPPPTDATQRRGSGLFSTNMGATIIEISGGDADARVGQSGPGTDKTFVILAVKRFGLPFHSLFWESYGVRAGPRSQEISEAADAMAGWRSGLHVSNPSGPGKRGFFRRLPILPLWPGMITNTLFFALLLWMLFVMPGWVRRVNRHRRGLCPACAYPIGSSPNCSECGEPLPS